jgi:hypothetical protein
MFQTPFFQSINYRSPQHTLESSIFIVGIIDSYNIGKAFNSGYKNATNTKIVFNNVFVAFQYLFPSRINF